MRLHVCALPHTHTVTKDYGCCAYTSKIIGFCRMMKDQGNAAFLYAGEQNEAPCDELITCISEKERSAAVGSRHYTEAPFDSALPHWRTFNGNAIAGIKARAEPHDIICVIAGIAHQPIADAFPNMLTVEFGIGYSGTFAKYRVFESYAWAHVVYGAQAGGNAHDTNVRWFDEIIPGYLDPADFPYRREKDDYCLFVGRMIERKGIQIAVDVCKALGKRLVVAGPGVPPQGCEYVGVVGPEERGRLMAGAQCLLTPTIYIEPFGNVAIEAMACGTPVVATDFGAFTETVIQGVTGFRCRSLQQFCDGVERAPSLDPAKIRQHVVDNYSLNVIARKYQDYFERLSTLWTGGWYERK